MRRLFCTLCLIVIGISSVVSQNIDTSDNIWEINQDGNICWKVDSKTYGHHDHIEMSGKEVSTVVRYGITQTGEFEFSRGMVWPLLRTIPNNTHASLMRRMSWNIMDEVLINKIPFKSERVLEVEISGLLTVTSEITGENGEKLDLKRELFPSTSSPMFCEKYTITNRGSKEVNILIPNQNIVTTTESSDGVNGSYEIVCGVEKMSPAVVKVGEQIEFRAYTAAYKSNESRSTIDVDAEILERNALVRELRDNLVLETPDRTINTLFNFAKLRGSESIFETKGGPMHGPGGESYYAAIWANDQAEYINPFFPFLGYSYGNASALNSYKHFATFMNDEFKPIPSSIIAEGVDIWNGAGDRGDAAMIAYGAARYLLVRGDMDEVKELWPLVEWCLEYCKRNLNDEGVVSSDTDELENRFESGDANLCTSSLYYDALLSSSYLAKELGHKGLASQYKREAAEMKQNIDKFFGADIEGYKSYRYYEENTVLRSWICMPLTVDIFDRKDETIKALFSDRLWTDNGLLTEAGSETFWDRSTLYALRGVLAAGEVKKGMDFLSYYSNRRLLGDHVPYPVEAYPEGGQRHLSAESGLYCRIITEGLFGIRPIGMKTFTLSPKLPADWNNMAMRNIKGFSSSFDIEIERAGEMLLVTITNNGEKVLVKKIKENSSLKCRLK